MKRGRARPAGSSAKVAAIVPDVSAVDARTRIGDLLVASGAITRDEIESAAGSPHEGRIGAALRAIGLLSEADVTGALSEQLRIPIVDLRDAEPEEEATAFVSASEMTK